MEFDEFDEYMRENMREFAIDRTFIIDELREKKHDDECDWLEEGF